ncbi:MAG: hypothetical protein QX196_08340 [Methylococcaceae bacterium]
MKEKKLSNIVIEMAQQILGKKNPSSAAIDVAVNMVHIAWNFAHEKYQDEPGYIFSVKEIQERMGSANNELISENAAEMTKILMLYKLEHYPNDKRNIVLCEVKNGEVLVTFL